MSSSGSCIESSSSGSKAKKKDKSKKEKKAKKAKKGKKEDKKGKKDDKKGKKEDKSKKRIEAAKEWFCDRLDAVKYTRVLLEIDPNVATELEVLFESLDEGEVVRIDGLENKQVKKKLRHLLQALKLTPVGENGFKSADKKVAFSSLFTECLRRAHEKNAKESGAAAAAAPEVLILDEPVPAVQSAPADLREAGAAECGEDAALLEEAPPPKPKKPRIKGPQLPTASIGAVDGGSSEAEESSDHADDQGPRLKGTERAGVDLSALPEGSRRESWMTQAHDSLGGMFVDTPAGAHSRADQFTATRSKAEVEAFEKAMKERGGSLLEQTREGQFARDDNQKKVDEMHKARTAYEDQWGMSEKQQDMRRLGVAGGGASVARKPFNPEEDMKVRKPMAAADFNKFVEEAGGELAGRFARGGLATSFL